MLSPRIAHVISVRIAFHVHSKTNIFDYFRALRCERNASLRELGSFANPIPSETSKAALYSTQCLLRFCGLDPCEASLVASCVDKLT